VAGAACESVTVQVVVPLGTRVDAAHCSAETAKGATSDNPVVLEEPFRVAVTAADALVAKDPATALKLALADPEGIVREAGTLRSAELELRETMREELAAALSVTEQTAVDPEAKETGLHARLLMVNPGEVPPEEPIAMLPAVVDTVTAVPVGEAPEELLRPIVTVPLAPAASVIET
jgi:hypothetical protein